MKLSILGSTALFLSGVILLSANAQAHVGGHKLDDAQCSAAWAMASPNGDAIVAGQAELYVVNTIYVDGDADGWITLEEFKVACANGLMTDAAVTMSEECTDTHMAQMDDMIAMMTDATKKSEAMTHLEMSKAALKKGDTAECIKHMIEAHRDMGM
jgi:hypothetical protein